MKRIITTMFCLGIMLGGKAQIAEWLIAPEYENIHIDNNADVIVTDSAGTKVVWSMNGERLITTTDEISSFKEDLAISTDSESAAITGIYRTNGEFIPIKDYHVALKYPYFSNGKLLVQQNVLYSYIDSNGNLFKDKCIMAYPYFNGYAVCTMYMNFEKQKDLYHILLNDKGESTVFFIDDKEVDPEDINFVSSINDEKIGIVVIKRKVYLFDVSQNKLQPIFITENTPENTKEQAKVEGEFNLAFIQNSDSTYTFSAKCGKKGFISFNFDLMLKPISIKRNDTEYTYKTKKITNKVYTSPLKASHKNNLFGINWDDEEMLPPQFDEFLMAFENKALVKLNGKYGMLKIHKDKNFRLKINKGDDIAFRHQKFETTVRLDLPTIIPADKTSLEINPESGCNLDMTSKESKNTESGNYVQYNCVLNIPSQLPDVLTEIEYPVTIQYEGLTSSTIPFKVKAWYYKYFVVDIDDSQTTLDHGTVSFVFNINAERIANDGIYPTTVNIVTDSLQYELEKMSEIRYKCKVVSLNEGINNITVQVLEQGCPPAEFPFEVEYHKPVARTRTKEKVTIKKKPKTTDQKSGPRVMM